MPRPKKKVRNVRGRQFTLSVDSRRNTSGSPSILQPHEVTAIKRFNKKLVQTALENENIRHVTKLPGIKLRPKSESQESLQVYDSSNDIIDLALLNESQSKALREHQTYAQKQRRPGLRHPIVLRSRKIRNLGFGVSIEFVCSGCRFVSSPYKLYTSTATGGCSTNVQVGAALSKVPIKASDAAFLFSSLNVNGPSEITIQKHFTAACSSSSQVLEASLSENRETVHDYVAIVGRKDGLVPSVSVALDGQFNRPVYHGYDGRSTSVSEPVIENETGLNLLVSHAVVSKLDNTYAHDKVTIGFLIK